MTLPQREYDRSTNSEIERLLYQVNVIRMDTKGLVSGMSREEFNWSPAPAAWSVGQCVEHLNLSDRQWHPFFEEAIAGGRSRGLTSKGPFTYGFLSRQFLRALEPPVGMKVKAPKGFQPGANLEPDEVLSRFLENQERLESLLRQADGLDLARIKVRSAFARYIRFSLGMAFWIIATHDRRHIWQAREVCRAPGFPTSAPETAIRLAK